MPQSTHSYRDSDLACPGSPERKDSLCVGSDREHHHSGFSRDSRHDTRLTEEQSHRMGVESPLANGRLTDRQPSESLPSQNGGESPCPSADVPKISVSVPDEPRAQDTESFPFAFHHSGSEDPPQDFSSEQDGSVASQDDTLQTQHQPEERPKGPLPYRPPPPPPPPPPDLPPSYSGPAVLGTAPHASELLSLPHLIPPPPPPSIPRPPSSASTYLSPLSHHPNYQYPPSYVHHEFPGPPSERLYRFKDKLEEACDQQENHRERREEALLERQELQRRRQELRDGRTKTRDIQARLVGELRQVCLNIKPLDYAAIFELYDQVERAHDKLGILEEYYDEDERKYDILEMQWTKNEGDIIGNLIEDIEELDIIPARENEVEPAYPPLATSPDFASTKEVFPNPESSSDSAEIQTDYTKFSTDDVQPGPAEKALGFSSTDYRVGPEDELDIVPHDTTDKHASQLWETVRPHMDVLKTPAAPLIDKGRRASEPASGQSHISKTAVHSHKAAARRPKSEADIAGVESPGQSIRSQVSQWIMESLKGSLLQKALAKAQLREDDLDEKDWWDQLRRVWSTDAANEEPEGNEDEEEEDYVSVESEAREDASQDGVSSDWS